MTKKKDKNRANYPIVSVNKKNVEEDKDPQINIQINNLPPKEKTPDPNTVGWSPKMKGVKTYNFLNVRGEIVGAMLIQEEGITQTVISQVCVAFLKAGFSIQNGTSLEASALFERQLVAEQKDLFSGQ